MERNKWLTKLRPKITTIESGQTMTATEQFQNEVLRPILKFQNKLIQKLFNSKSRIGILSALSESDQRFRIRKTLEKNTELRHQLTGLVVGLFSVDEFCIFLEQEAELKRRIKTMLVERLIVNQDESKM